MKHTANIIVLSLCIIQNWLIMNLVYFGSVFMAAVVYVLMALLLFLQRREGERSRVILAGLVLVSVLNYSSRIASLLQGEMPSLLVSVPMLIVGLFMVISYIIYPVEVISPGWITWKRLLRMYSPIGVLLVVYWISMRCGATYETYGTLVEMLPHLDQFGVWFRLLLCGMMFMPLLFILFPTYTKKYNNTNREWIRRYIVIFVVNSLGYIVVLAFDNLYVKAGYYFVSVGCELCLVYLELFVRLISRRTQQVPVIIPVPHPVEEVKVPCKYESLYNQLEAYMREEQLWSDPDLTIQQLAINLKTNRTDLGYAIREQGYENYTDYINRLRMDYFMQLVHRLPMATYQELFFEVGYRSKTTALRNFRQYYGCTPSEYFENYKGE